MNKLLCKENNIRRFRLAYLIAVFLTLFGGMSIYAFFRNINNMILFQFIPKPSVLVSLYIPIKSDSIWSNMLIYNLPYGLWCLSGLLLVRAVWLKNAKWQKIYKSIFIVIVMSYVILKLPGVIHGTFDVLDLLFIGFFAFLESIFFILFIRRKIV
jgi:hypothetical protein